MLGELEEGFFSGLIVNSCEACFQTLVNGKCISLGGDDSCVNDGVLRRFYLTVFLSKDKKVAITNRIFPKKAFVVSDSEVEGTLGNFLKAVKWCEKN